MQETIYSMVNNEISNVYEKSKFKVWLASGCISVPPLIGWNDWSGESLKTHCQLTTEKAFIIFSASGSFFVPLILMIIVYVKIFLAARQRIRTNRGILRFLMIEPEIF